MATTGSPDAVSLTLIAAAGLVALIGLLDDLFSLPWALRLAVYSVAAVAVILRAGAFVTFDLRMITIHLASAGAATLTFLWLVGLTNAYNFMDGIDGIAGAQGLLAAATWGLIAAPAGQHFVAGLSFSLAGAALGFLVHNLPPAKVFMGDVGSTFLGYVLACVALLMTSAEPRLFLAGPLVVWPFLFDTIVTFFRRLRRREHVFSAHRSHLYQRLVMSGLTHAKVTLIYTGAAALGSATAVALARRWDVAAGVLGMMVVAAAVGIYSLVTINEARDQRR
jgi:UDP-N-acetylmuramyl pentapeptide phosphotransferase/UDP-N-acetylglucosamine-1-phosphate transferase